MRHLLISVLLFCNSVAAQHTDSTQVIYVDSIAMEITKTYLDPDNIKEINKVKRKDASIYSGAPGTIFITRKLRHPFITLSDIGKQNVPSDSLLAMVFVIDKKLITDTSMVRLEISAIKSIDILRDADGGIRHGNSQITYLIETKIKR